MIMYNIENNKVNNTTFLANCVKDDELFFTEI